MKHTVQFAQDIIWNFYTNPSESPNGKCEVVVYKVSCQNEGCRIQKTYTEEERNIAFAFKDVLHHANCTGPVEAMLKKLLKGTLYGRLMS